MAHTTALRRILLALAFVPSSAFLAVPSVRAQQLAGSCPKTLPRPAAPARFGQPMMVRIASGGERDAIEDAVRIYKDAVRAKEAGALDEADALFTNATDLLIAVTSSVAFATESDRLWFVLGTPTRPRGKYVEAITFAIFYTIMYASTIAIMASPIFLAHVYDVLDGRPLYSELSVSDANIRIATIISEGVVIFRLSPLWFVLERMVYHIYDVYAISFLRARYAREDKE